MPGWGQGDVCQVGDKEMYARLGTRRSMPGWGQGDVDLEKNGNIELDSKEDKQGSIKDCLGRQKTCQHDCHQEK